MIVDVWNIDIAIPDRMHAIEIDPGHWHDTIDKAPIDIRKNRALVKAGWRVFRFTGDVVRLSNSRLLDLAKQMVGEYEIACGDPSALGEHRVIRCQAQGVPRGSHNYKFTFTPGRMHLNNTAR